MALVADPSFEAVVIPALKVLTRRAVGPLGRAAIRVEGVGEIFGVGSLSLPVAPAVFVQTVAAAIMMLEFGDILSELSCIRRSPRQLAAPLNQCRFLDDFPWGQKE